jgi:hypothetical protein
MAAVLVEDKTVGEMAVGEMVVVPVADRTEVAAAPDTAVRAPAWEGIVARVLDTAVAAVAAVEAVAAVVANTTLVAAALMDTAAVAVIASS